MDAFFRMLSELVAAWLGDRWLGHRTEAAERRLQELAQQKGQASPPVSETTATESPASPPGRMPPPAMEEKFKGPVKTDHSPRETLNK